MITLESSAHCLTRIAVVVFAIVSSIAASAADIEVPEPFAPEEAARTMVVPEGFNVKLFAGEPDVRQPISFCIDDRGRLWVAEAYNYPFRDKEPQDRVLILEDTDGDGKSDKRTVFYDKLGYVTGIEVGFGGVWIMSPPEMLFIPDKDGDDRPDGPPEVLLDGFGNTTSAHNIANGFTWGPDGWLYAGHGRTSPSDVGPPGTPAEERIHHDGGVTRYHPTRHVFETFCDGTTNPWGVAFDDYGQAIISNCVNPHLFHAIQGRTTNRGGTALRASTPSSGCRPSPIICTGRGRFAAAAMKLSPPAEGTPIAARWSTSATTGPTVTAARFSWATSTAGGSTTTHWTARAAATRPATAPT